jgi:hypothetical protein
LEELEMKTRLFATRALTAALLAGAAGHAAAQPIIDGSLGSDPYGPILWVQNQPTTFGNNVAGAGGTLGDPQNVTKGVELAIPMAALGNPSTIRLAGFINGQSHDFASNQFIGSLPTNQGNPGEPRNINLNNFADPQFINLNASVVGTAPVIDGTLGADYGAAKFIQGNYTQFGNNTLTTGTTANGSEIDAVYAVIFNSGTPADASDDVLHLFIAGNLETNFNKLELFFDTGVGGQNRLRGDNAPVDGGGLNRMGDNNGTNGLTFDTGFDARYWVMVTNGGSPTVGVYINYAELLAAGGGPGFYCGTTTPQSNGVLTGGDVGAPVIAGTVDNSNTAGVTGTPTGLSIPHPDVSNGSEIDGLYGVVQNGRLYLLLTGNLENNFNKIDLFFDVNATDGQNQLRSDNCDVEFNGLNRMGNGGNGTVGAGPGLKFDAGFFADYWLSFTNGGYPVDNFANAAVLRANGPIYSSGFILDYSAFDGGAKSTNNPIDFPATYADIQDFTTTDPLNTDGGPRKAQEGMLIPGLLTLSINNSNVGGVSGTNPIDVSGAASVTTGLELSIDLAELGWDGGPIRVAGFVNANGHAYVSNQVLGGLPTPVGEQYAAELGEPTLVDFSSIADNQWVLISTAPTCGSADFDCDGDTGTDADIEAFFACLAGSCPSAPCTSTADFDADGDTGTDADIESFFRVLAGGPC